MSIRRMIITGGLAHTARPAVPPPQVYHQSAQSSTLWQRMSHTWNSTLSTITPSVEPSSLVLVTPGMDDIFQASLTNSYVPDGAVFMRVHAESAEDDMIRNIEKQVREHGSLKALIIEAHGGPNLIAPHDNRNNIFSAEDFLNKIEALQHRLGIKITNRIHFIGCNVFTHENSSDVNFYRNKAKSLGADIAGNTTAGWSFYKKQKPEFFGLYQPAPLAYSIARVAVFKANGDVGRDIDDDPFDSRLIASGGKKYNGNSSWFNCYAGKSQQQGEACQRSIAKNQHANNQIGSLAAHTESSLSVIQQVGNKFASRTALRTSPPLPLVTQQKAAMTAKPRTLSPPTA